MTLTGETITRDDIRNLRENGSRTIDMLNACDMALAALRGEFGAGVVAARRALDFCADSLNARNGDKP